MLRTRVLALACLGTIAFCTPAWAAPALKGWYRLATTSDGKQTVRWADVFKKADKLGEIVIGFEDDRFILGMWVVDSFKDPKRPKETLVTVCRSQLAFAPAWTGTSFTLPSKMKTEGWASSFHVTTTKKGKTTSTVKMTNEPSCAFGLEKGTYAVAITASDEQGPTAATLTSDKGVLQLERSIAVEKIDTEKVVEKYLGE